MVHMEGMNGRGQSLSLTLSFGEIPGSDVRGNTAV